LPLSGKRRVKLLTKKPLRLLSLAELSKAADRLPNVAEIDQRNAKAARHIVALREKVAQ
jgi:hypothetical protein